jgi:hypothetical protein
LFNIRHQPVIFILPNIFYLSDRRENVFLNTFDRRLREGWVLYQLFPRHLMAFTSDVHNDGRKNSIPFLPLSCLPKRTNLPFLDDPELTVNSLSASLLYRREEPSAITMQMYRDQPADLVH